MEKRFRKRKNLSGFKHQRRSDSYRLRTQEIKNTSSNRSKNESSLKVIKNTSQMTL